MDEMVLFSKLHQSRPCESCCSFPRKERSDVDEYMVIKLSNKTDTKQNSNKKEELPTCASSMREWSQDPS